MPPPVEIHPILGIPEIRPGNDLAACILAAMRAQDLRIVNGDVLVVAQKIVSKAEGRIVRLDGIVPTERARAWAEEWSKDARAVELVLRESRRIVRMERGIIVAETAHGFVCANAGVDLSNTEAGTAILLPEAPDASARILRTRLESALGAGLGVVISDTFGRPWREGLVNVALGVSGIASLTDYRGAVDTHGNVLQATMIAVADEIASAAELVMGKSDGVPAAIVRGVSVKTGEGSGDLLRPAERDLFR